MVFHVNWFQDFMNQYQSLNDPANRILFVAINNPLMSDLPRVIISAKNQHPEKTPSPYLYLHKLEYPRLQKYRCPPLGKSVLLHRVAANLH